MNTDEEFAAANALEAREAVLAAGREANVIVASDLDGDIGSGSGRIQAPVLGNIRVEGDDSG